MKTRPVGTDLYDPDGQTAMTKLVVTFPNFMKAPKNLRDLNQGKYQTMLLIHLVLSVLRKHVQEFSNCEKKM